MHKEQVNQIEECIEATKILIDGLRDGTTATMRCVRICYHLFKKGRPFSDYPELVATKKASGSFTGETNHSNEFPRHFLNSVAHVVNEKNKANFNAPLLHTGFQPTVKLIADKNTIKHRAC